MYDIHFRVASLRVLSSLSNLSQSARLLHVSKASLSRWTKRLHPLHWSKQSPVCTPFLCSSVQELLQHTLYFSLRSLAHDLKTLYGLSVSKQLLHLLVSKRFGYSFKRTKTRGVSKNTSHHQYYTPPFCTNIVSLWNGVNLFL